MYFKTMWGRDVKKLLLAGMLLLMSSSAMAQQNKWVLWFQATSGTNDGNVLDVHWEPVLETITLLDCNKSREASLADEEKRSNGKRAGDGVVVKVENTKVFIVKRFHCYMYGQDPRLKK